MAKINHGTPEMFGVNSRDSHPFFDTFGQRHRVDNRVRQKNLFDFLNASARERKLNQSVLMRGGRVLPSLSK